MRKGGLEPPRVLPHGILKCVRTFSVVLPHVKYHVSAIGFEVGRAPAWLTRPDGGTLSRHHPRLKSPRECLDRVITLGERHLVRVARSYVDYSDAIRGPGSVRLVSNSPLSDGAELVTMDCTCRNR